MLDICKSAPLPPDVDLTRLMLLSGSGMAWSHLDAPSPSPMKKKN